jgi:hypothetical protein
MLLPHVPARTSDWKNQLHNHNGKKRVAARLQARQPEFHSQQGAEFFSESPRRVLLWDPPSHITNGYQRLFSRG